MKKINEFQSSKEPTKIVNLYYEKVKPIIARANAKMDQVEKILNKINNENS